MIGIELLEGVPEAKVLACLRRAPGKELESGKLASPESSAALAINAFGWFIDRPYLLPKLPGAPSWSHVESVDLEYCARFPWAGGRHPWLDAAVLTDSHLIGIESKRFEPFRDRKFVELSDAYDRPVWGDSMAPYEKIRDDLRRGTRAFHFLDATQLVKHAFGLVTDARRKRKKPHLHYLFAEPARRNGKLISKEMWLAHREEVRTFVDAVAGGEVSFSACSYREWLESWGEGAFGAHGARLMQRFEP
jgi:hypothetical protein